MTIETSLDWQKKRIELAEKIHKVGRHTRDLERMLDNIDPLVSQLGRIEVDIRGRQRGFRQHQEQLDLIRGRVEDLEQMITLASLM